jgi:hypothetical protein
MKKPSKIFKVLFVGLAVVFVLLISFRVSKDIKKKLSYPNTYAIQNVKTGKDIRVYNANYSDETKIILYSHNNWECMTWELIQMKDSTYLLKNLYTQKTFQPSSTPDSGVSLWQQPLGGNEFQYWEFLKQPDESYRIRLNDSDLYITITSDENNSEIVLMPKQESNNQLWRLVRQNPWK